MVQTMAIDYGKVRTGLAVTDQSGIIAFGLDTVETRCLLDFFQKFFSENKIIQLVIGLPTNLKGNLNELETDIQILIKEIKNKYPTLIIHRLDERFTSKIASYYINQSDLTKKKKQNKGLIDQVSATILLQNFLENQ